MKTRRPDQEAVTLLLHDMEGQEWPLSLSRGCLKFIGCYRRIEGFDIDELALFLAVRRDRQAR